MQSSISVISKTQRSHMIACYVHNIHAYLSVKRPRGCRKNVQNTSAKRRHPHSAYKGDIIPSPAVNYCCMVFNLATVDGWCYHSWLWLYTKPCTRLKTSPIPVHGLARRRLTSFSTIPYTKRAVGLGSDSEAVTIKCSEQSLYRYFGVTAIYINNWLFSF